MSLKYEQREIELKISDILDYSDITDISNISGIGYSYVDQMLNPNDERKSYIVGALEIQCALDEINPQKGDRLFHLYKTFRAMSKKITAEGCIKISTANLNKEIADVINFQIEGKSYYEQLEEIIEAESALQKQKQIVLSLINAEKESANGRKLRVS